jgi:hypothetical protein
MFFIHLLLLLLFFQAASGLLGGLLMIMDPSGRLLKLPLELLTGTPFNNYLIPGLILFIFLGAFPLLVIYTMIWNPDWRIFQRINIWNQYMAGWSAAVYVGIMLVGWIVVQVVLIGYQSYLQPVYLLVGISILIASFSSPTKKHFRITQID